MLFENQNCRIVKVEAFDHSIDLFDLLILSKYLHLFHPFCSNQLSRKSSCNKASVGAFHRMAENLTLDHFFRPIFLHQKFCFLHQKFCFFTPKICFFTPISCFFTPIFCFFYTNILLFLHQKFSFFTPKI